MADDAHDLIASRKTTPSDDEAVPAHSPADDGAGAGEPAANDEPRDQDGDGQQLLAAQDGDQQLDQDDDPQLASAPADQAADPAVDDPKGAAGDDRQAEPPPGDGAEPDANDNDGEAAAAFDGGLQADADQNDRTETTGFRKYLKYAPWMVAAALLVIGFLMFQRPVEPEDIPKMWNDAVKRLGVEPIYPLQAGVFVGDVFATVAPVRKEIANELSDEINPAFAGRTIKIASLDVTELLRRNGAVLRLPDTEFSDGAPTTLAMQNDYASVGALASDAGNIRLYDVAYPTVDIDSTRNLDSLWSWLAAHFKRTAKEKVSFEGVQTYSITPTSAAARLNRFCEEQGACKTDKYVRAHMAYSLGENIRATYVDNRDCKVRYVFDIELFMIYQAFMTRGVHISSDLASNIRFSGSARQEMKSIEDGKTVAYTDDSSSKLELVARFHRPLVFAYRRVGFTMPREAPPQTALEEHRDAVESCKNSRRG